MFTLPELQTELLEHSKEGRGGRNDAGFRLNIALAQMGNLAMHYTHDPAVNPSARPYGTHDSEISDFGHAMLQLMTYGAVRGIDLQQAAEMAMENLRSKDFQKKICMIDSGVKGLAVVPYDNLQYNRILGLAVLEEDVIWEANNSGNILIAFHPCSDARLTKFRGVITDHGGVACHAAVIAREYKLPCIVGTWNATSMLRTGDIIEMNLTTGDVKIRK